MTAVTYKFSGRINGRPATWQLEIGKDMFKAGDKVRCVDFRPGAEGSPLEGKEMPFPRLSTLEVSAYLPSEDRWGEQGVLLRGYPGRFRASRFVLAAQSDRPCLYAPGDFVVARPGLLTPSLEAGKVYCVLEVVDDEGDPCVKLVGVREDKYFYDWRFLPYSRRVQLESPLAGDVEANVQYAKACMKDSLLRGEAPFASHLLYTQVLDDGDKEQRKMGISAGFEYTDCCDLVAVYVDRGISPGMRQGIDRAKKAGKAIEYRSLSVELT